MAVQIIHIFKDGTVRDNLDGVVVPQEIVKQIYNIVRGGKEKEIEKNRISKTQEPYG